MQGVHVACHQDSFCHRQDYVHQKVLLTDQKTIEVYEKTLQSTSIYRYADSYCRVSVLYIMCTVDLHNKCTTFSAETLSGSSH